MGPKGGRGKVAMLVAQARRILTALSAVLVLAAAGPVAGNPSEEAYAECLARIGEDPEAAYERAQAWRRDGGGRPARHCAALALFALGHHHEAAERLEVLAEELNRSNKRLTIAALAQAGQAWLAAGELRRALAVQSAALNLAPGDVELLIDRSVTWDATKNYQEAIADLDRADLLSPKRAEIRILRASAHRKAGNRQQARADVERALELEPENPEGLLERGLLRRLEGETNGARSDWLDVLAIATEGPLAEAARRHLEALDVKAD